MRIAILGTRGIPARYGGFETFAEELARRLVKRGHEVTVYCRSQNFPYKERIYEGVKLAVLPTIRRKYLDTVFHTFLSILDSSFRKFELLLVCNAANSPLCIIPRLLGKKVLLNVDGVERERKKWGPVGKVWYRIGEFLSTLFPNAIITDAHVIEDYYLKKYQKKSFMIPYGAQIGKTGSVDELRRYQLEKDGYILYVSRLEPENNAHLVIRAFEEIRTEKRMVIVGDAPYAGDYKKRLMSTKDPRIIFTGFLFGHGYRELQSHAYCYVHATEVGGTHPALLDGMALGKCVLVNETPENLEVIGDTGIVYKRNDHSDLKEKLLWIIQHPEARETFSKKARERIHQFYTWDHITDQYESLFESVVT